MALKDAYTNPLFHMGLGILQGNQGQYGSPMAGLTGGLQGLGNYGQLMQAQEAEKQRQEAERIQLLMKAQQEARLQEDLEFQKMRSERAREALGGYDGGGMQPTGGGYGFQQASFSPVADYSQAPRYDSGTKKLSSMGLQRIMDIKAEYPDLGKKLLNEAFDKPKYTPKAKVMVDKQGRKFWHMIADDGSEKMIDFPEGVTAAEDIKMLDLKDAYQPYVPGKGPVGPAIPKGIPQEQTPEFAARKQEAVEESKFKANRKEDAFKAVKLYTNMKRDTDQVLKAVEEAREMVNWKTVGVGSYMDALPETKARAFKGKLTQLKANIAFQTLMKIKSQSVTGGALGQVSERELELLFSNLGSLDAGMSQADLNKVLDGIENHLKSSTTAIHGDISSFYKGYVPKGVKVPEAPKWGKPRDPALPPGRVPLPTAAGSADLSTLSDEELMNMLNGM